jgi:hypothetical protein
MQRQQGVQVKVIAHISLPTLLVVSQAHALLSRQM